MTKYTVDLTRKRISLEDGTEPKELPLYSPEAFELLSRLWTDVGWAQRYSYAFAWLGRPIIQLPEDMVRIQEAITEIRPAVVVETGVAHGGSLVFYASVLKALGVGRVVGIDIEIRPHNREAIESHELAEMITLIEGSSVDEEVVARVHDEVGADAPVLVSLDSNHTREHVLAELEAYAPLVTPGSYVIAMDGIMRHVADAPGGKPEWADDNPSAAAAEFAAGSPDFELVAPPRPFDESRVEGTPTYWPDGWLRRRR
jgi:cephalosporin hydroxylase